MALLDLQAMQPSAPKIICLSLEILSSCVSVCVCCPK
jgi:hypothetical protein